MKNRNNIKEYAELQYKSPQNLNARMNLWSYGSNPESLQKKLKVCLEMLENLFKIRNSLINEKIKLIIKKRWKNNE